MVALKEIFDYVIPKNRQLRIICLIGAIIFLMSCIYIFVNITVQENCCNYQDTSINCKKLGEFHFLCLCKIENDVGFDEENNLITINEKYYANNCEFGKEPITLQEMIRDAKQKI